MKTTVVSLESVCTAIVDCEHKTAPIDESGDHFAVGTPAMREGVIDFSQARRISRETFELWTRRMRPKQGDLLFAREAPVGPIVRIPAEENVAPGQRTVLLRPDANRVFSDFLFYLLGSPAMQHRFQERAAGSTVAHLNVADVRAFELSALPTLSVQRAIAGILGALDDTITANRKLAKTADQLACALFADAVSGLVPSERTFGDVVSVSGGGTPSTKVDEYWDGEIGWATPTDVTALGAPYLFSTARTITQLGLDSCASSLYPLGSILMTSRATIGAFAVAETPVAVNQGFIVAHTSDDALKWWIFHEMRSRVAEFLSYANGATFLELGRGKFKQLKVRLPERGVLDSFGQNVSMLHASATEAMKEIDSLILIRDSLLPRLMSGELTIRDAERQVEEVL